MKHWQKIGLGSVLLLALTAGQVRGLYLGCYEDDIPHLLPDYRVELTDINTPNKCGYICTRLGHSYAGVQGGTLCFCGNQRPFEDRKRSDGDCQTSCPMSREKCGGTGRLAVYSMAEPERPNTGYLGCYEDSADRLLPESRIDLVDINSPKKCSDLCMALGFPYAGLEVGVECFCGKQKPGEDKKRMERECFSFCPFSMHSCGGSWRLSVYSYPINETSQTDISGETIKKRYLGCFEDNARRIMDGFQINFQNINSPVRCIHLCKQLGFSYAGVEIGFQCFCGNIRPEEALKRNGCASYCPHSEEKCGGTWRIGVYEIDGLPEKGP